MVTKIIKHIDATQVILEEIASLKSLRWPYTLTQHIDWFQKNIHSNDLHLLIYDGNEIVAYMNLVSVEITIDGKIHKVLGIGNVCTRESGKGLGTLLMEEANNYLKLHNIGGLLFCKDQLVPYYQKHEWMLFDKNNIDGISSEINTMIFNIGIKDSSILYSDRSF